MSNCYSIACRIGCRLIVTITTNPWILISCADALYSRSVHMQARLEVISVVINRYVKLFFDVRTWRHHTIWITVRHQRGLRFWNSIVAGLGMHISPGSPRLQGRQARQTWRNFDWLPWLKPYRSRHSVHSRSVRIEKFNNFLLSKKLRIDSGISAPRSIETDGLHLFFFFFFFLVNQCRYLHVITSP